ncbi:MAG TPA: M28 family peptidase, partial [Phycisphaerae bacterium]|nr:M28 family peptidase [Phycisphaerae bacterium]
ADTDETIGDRQEVPATTIYWSGPLASADAPAVGGVVDGDAIETITPEAVDGKFVLTGKYPLEMKNRLVSAGARPLAVVSDFLGTNRAYTDDTVRWCNGWADGPGGWYFHAGDTVMTGFSISPARGKALRQRMAADPGLKLSAFCDSRLYEGSGQNVTGILEGTDPGREIWIYGHACEQGAHDNVSGQSVLVETLRTLNDLVVAGKLPRPRCSIRMITTEECIGMVAFASINDDLRRRAMAGMNVDGAGDPALADHPLTISYGPWSNPSISWAVAAIAAAAVKEAAGDGWHWRMKRFVNNADDMIADPHAGVPGQWIGKAGDSLGYHSSADTPEVCSDDSLRYNTALTAAWAYTMASLGETSAAELIAPAAAWIDGEIVKEGDDDPARLSRWVAGRILRDLTRWDVPESVYEQPAARYAPADAPPLPDLPAEGPRYIRRTWGTSTFERLPAEKRKGLSCWSATINSGFYWCDGKLPLPALERLASAETGNNKGVNLRHAFEAALEAGIMVEDNTDNFRKK